MGRFGPYAGVARLVDPFAQRWLSHEQPLRATREVQLSSATATTYLNFGVCASAEAECLALDVAHLCGNRSRYGPILVFPLAAAHV